MLEDVQREGLGPAPDGAANPVQGRAREKSVRFPSLASQQVQVWEVKYRAELKSAKLLLLKSDEFSAV